MQQPGSSIPTYSAQNLSWYNRPVVRILLHAAFWLLLFSLPFLLGNRQNEAKGLHEKEGFSSTTLFFLISNLLWVALFYINTQWLIPGILYKKKLLAFITAHLMLIGMYLLLNRFLRLTLTEPNHFNQRSFDFFTFLIYLFITGASSTFRLIRDHMRTEQVQKETQHEKLKTELSFLRSQVSPHFMFNVLNNMVALARKKSDLLEPSLIKLSSLMRYMLYETDGEKVSLDKETEYLQSYIDLQQQRYGSKLELKVQMDPGEDPVFIEPMLLIPFVENAFKHGTGSIENPVIEVQLHSNKGALYFSVSNKFVDYTEEIKDKTSGIGLTNVARRLELLYPGTHQLEIDKKEGIFTVTLNLKFA